MSVSRLADGCGCPIDWLEDPSADDDENSPFGFNEDFESECYGDDSEE